MLTIIVLFIVACFVVPGNLRVLQLSSFRAMQRACVKEYIPANNMKKFEKQYWWTLQMKHTPT